jgi:hypothetical protein
MNYIDRLKELDKQATSGPWVSYLGLKHLQPADAELIATLRNALPLFLELVEVAEWYADEDNYYEGLAYERDISKVVSDKGYRMSDALAKLKGDL